MSYVGVRRQRESTAGTAMEEERRCSFEMCDPSPRLFPTFFLSSLESCWLRGAETYVRLDGACVSLELGCLQPQLVMEHAFFCVFLWTSDKYRMGIIFVGWNRLCGAVVLVVEVHSSKSLFSLCWKMIPGVLCRTDAMNDVHPSSR